jgi:hypothetical protein
LRNINLTVEEWRVVSFINPRNSIRQIAEANNLSEFQIRRIVYGMLQAGLVQEVRPQKPAQAVPDQRGGRGQPQQMIEQSPRVKRSVVTRLIDRIKGL